jgi:hypothetical protein
MPYRRILGGEEPVERLNALRQFVGTREALAKEVASAYPELVQPPRGMLRSHRSA